MYYRGARAACAVYDISDAQTFEGAKRWITELKEKAGSTNAMVVLVGNKSDLGPALRQVRREEAKSFAENNGLFFFECSAKADAASVSSLFDLVARRLPEEERRLLMARRAALSAQLSILELEREAKARPGSRATAAQTQRLQRLRSELGATGQARHVVDRSVEALRAELEQADAEARRARTDEGRDHARPPSVTLDGDAARRAPRRDRRGRCCN
jgi:GTPase SAR1 family protein